MASEDVLTKKTSVTFVHNPDGYDYQCVRVFEGDMDQLMRRHWKKMKKKCKSEDTYFRSAETWYYFSPKLRTRLDWWQKENARRCLPDFEANPRKLTVTLTTDAVLCGYVPFLVENTTVFFVIAKNDESNDEYFLSCQQGFYRVYSTWENPQWDPQKQEVKVKNGKFPVRRARVVKVGDDETGEDETVVSVTLHDTTYRCTLPFRCKRWRMWVEEPSANAGPLADTVNGYVLHGHPAMIVTLRRVVPLPALDGQLVHAGGGSVCWVDEGRRRPVSDAVRERLFRNDAQVVDLAVEVFEAIPPGPELGDDTRLVYGPRFEHLYLRNGASIRRVANARVARYCGFCNRPTEADQNISPNGPEIAYSPPGGDALYIPRGIFYPNEMYTIRSATYGGYLFAGEARLDDERRHVLAWCVAKFPKRGLGMFWNIIDCGGYFQIWNFKWNESFYAGDRKHDAERRYTLTISPPEISRGPGSRHRWQIISYPNKSYYGIRNIRFGEYLYVGRPKLGENQLSLTWIPRNGDPTNDGDARWEIQAVIL